MNGVEQQLADYFEDLDHVLDRHMPPAEEIVAGTMRRVRRRRLVRRLRNACEWTAATAVVAALVGGGYAIWSSATGESGQSAAGSKTATTAGSSTATTAGSSTATTAAATPQQRSAESVTDTLARLLGSYGSVTSRHPSLSSGQQLQLPTDKAAGSPPAGWVTLDAGDGPAAVAASVADSTSAPRSTQRLSCPSAARGVSCAVQTLPDGTVVLRERDSSGSPDSASVWFVVAGRADGVQVQVDEWNGPQPKGRAATGMATPPLSLAQLQDIAVSDRW
jgi:hypothetical protein